MIQPARLPGPVGVHAALPSFHNLPQLETPVEFPLEGLDMQPYMLQPQQPVQQQPQPGPLLYDLFAVSNHFGGLGGE